MEPFTTEVNILLYWIIVTVHLIVALLAALHALLYKRDYRASLGWLGIIIVFPVAGPLLYLLFGVNRIRTRARLVSGRDLPYLEFSYERSQPLPVPCPDPLEAELPEPRLAVVGRNATGDTLLGGNRVEPLYNGEQFYPRLLEAIAGAQHHVALSSYLFSAHGIAGEIIEALGAAANRGVNVAVLIDGVGAWYSLRRAVHRLRRRGVQVATFNPPTLLPPSFAINLRNHRKIAVIDNRVAFFGGINIDQRHLVQDSTNRTPTEDVHFVAEGPVVAALQALLSHDWWMATRETLTAPAALPSQPGQAACRVIADGPDESLDYLSMTLQGVFASARHSISIMMPYFLPAREMLAALQTAALRGVQVRILLPERSNLRMVDWATRNMLWELLMWRVEVYFKPPPFAHSKLIVVDEQYVMAGSANLDPRSLRLNFELGVEIFDIPLAQQLSEHINACIAVSRPVELAELDSRPFWQRVRDAGVWLFSGYL